MESTCKELTISNTNTPALKWGIDNEKNAITQYTKFQRKQGHKNFKIYNCGLFLYHNVLAIQKKKLENFHIEGLLTIHFCYFHLNYTQPFF